MAGKRKRHTSKKGQNRAHWSLRHDNKGEPLWWVDEEEWRTWPRCKICGQLIRRIWTGKQGRAKVAHHEGCRLGQRGRADYLDRYGTGDMPAAEIERIEAQAKAQIAYERRMGQR